MPCPDFFFLLSKMTEVVDSRVFPNFWTCGRKGVEIPCLGRSKWYDAWLSRNLYFNMFFRGVLWSSEFEKQLDFLLQRRVEICLLLQVDLCFVLAVSVLLKDWLYRWSDQPGGASNGAIRNAVHRKLGKGPGCWHIPASTNFYEASFGVGNMSMCFHGWQFSHGR